MKQRKRRKPKFLKLKVDLSGWETGEWPYWLEECIDVNFDKDTKSMSLGVNVGLLENATKKIATDAIKAFLLEECSVDLRDGCVVFSDDTGRVLEIDLVSVDFILSPKYRDALVRRLNAIKYTDDGKAIILDGEDYSL